MMKISKGHGELEGALKDLDAEATKAWSERTGQTKNKVEVAS